MPQIRFNAGRFLRIYGLVFVALAVSHLALSWTYLQRIGELNLDAVVERQASDQFCLFGSGIEQDNYTYKLALYDKIRPDTVVLGSSRVMQIRGGYFLGSFVNLGGAAGSTVALAKFVNEMLETGHTPKLAIVGLDFWWFNPAYAKNEVNFQPLRGAYSVTFDRLKLPLYWLLEDKVQYQDIGRALFAEEADCRLGVMARQLSDGFGPDGSYYYTSFISGQRAPGRSGFQEVLSRITEGRDRFEWGETVSREDVARLAQTVHRLEAGVRGWCCSCRRWRRLPIARYANPPGVTRSSRICRPNSDEQTCLCTITRIRPGSDPRIASSSMDSTAARLPMSGCSKIWPGMSLSSRQVCVPMNCGRRHPGGRGSRWSPTAA